MRRFQVRWLLVAVAVVLAAVTALAGQVAPAEATNQNRYIFPPNSNPFGHSYAEWGKSWWEWGLSFPSASNPILEGDGPVEFGDADDQPPGRVWYLAGTFGGSVERELSVPTDKALFFPLWNFFTWSPEDCVWLLGKEPDEGCTAAEMHDAVDDLLANGPAMSASLDDVDFTSLTSYRARLAGSFPYTILPGSLGAEGYPLGTRDPTISDGYYLMLKPLSEGEHTVHFAVDGFLDVTYHLDVEP